MDSDNSNPFASFDVDELDAIVGGSSAMTSFRTQEYQEEAALCPVISGARG